MTHVVAAPAVRAAWTDDPDALEALRDEWSALWDACPRASVFQSPEWLIPWWRNLGGGEGWTLTLRDAGELVGLAPFFIHTHPDGTRQVTLVGNGASDRPGILLHPRLGPHGGARVLDALADEGARWDACDFADLSPGAPLLDAPLPEGMEDAVEACAVTPVLPLPDDEERLDAAVPKTMLSKMRYYRRRAEKQAPLRIDRADAASVDGTLDALFRLHAARWRARGEGGVLAEDAMQALVREAAAGLLARGWLRLYALRVGGETAAVQLGFTAKARASYYIGGFDPAFASLSPGALLVEHAIRDAVREGAREFDFLRGAEPYKYQWGARDRPLGRRIILHKPLRPDS